MCTFMLFKTLGSNSLSSSLVHPTLREGLNQEVRLMETLTPLDGGHQSQDGAIGPPEEPGN